LECSHRAGSIKPSAIRRMLELSAQMENVVHLEQGEPDFITPDHILEAAVDAIEKGLARAYAKAKRTHRLHQI
jgi:aminotransferase